MAASPRTRPAKAALSRAAIVAAALAVVDEVGYEAASMRRIAQALDTGPASLYVYVADRHELMVLAYDLALAGVALPTAQDGDWRSRVELLVNRMVAALGVHDDLAAVALNDVPVGPESLRIGEELLRLLRAGGIADAQVAWGVDLLAQYIVSSALEAAGWQRAQRRAQGHVADPASATPHAMSDAFVGHLRAVYADLDPARFPHLHGLRHLITAGGGEARASWKLRVVLDGLLAQS